MSRVYNTMLTKDYVLDWSVANGVREFISNWLDSEGKSEFDFSSSWIELTNKNIKLDASCLTIGTSGSRFNKDAVGVHGEGILIGLIPLLREGIHVELRNSDVVWIPKFVYNEDFRREILVIEETEYNNGIDYTVFISGLKSSDIDEVIESCLYLQKDLGRVRVGSTGRVLEDIQGKLYVGGMLVTDLPRHKYSYDFHPQHLSLNRDRKSVDTWDLADNTAKLLEEVFPTKELVGMVKENSIDTGSFYTKLKSEAVAEEAYSDFKEKHGYAVVAKSSDELTELKNKGYKNVSVVYNDQYRELIKRSDSYNEFVESLEETLEEVEIDDRTPIDMLEEWYSTEADGGDCGHWIKFEALIEVFKERGVEWQ